MARAALAKFQIGAPMGEMNTTPLIDVLLVLLVMFILAVPAAVNEVPFDLPAQSDQPLTTPIRAQNDLTIDARGQAAWNGQPIGDAALFAALRQTASIAPEPLVRFTPDGTAPYSASARVLRLIKMAGVTTFAFVGNEQYADFAKAALPPAAPAVR